MTSYFEASSFIGARAQVLQFRTIKADLHGAFREVEMNQHYFSRCRVQLIVCFDVDNREIKKSERYFDRSNDTSSLRGETLQNCAVGGCHPRS